MLLRENVAANDVAVCESSVNADAVAGAVYADAVCAVVLGAVAVGAECYMQILKVMWCGWLTTYRE